MYIDIDADLYTSSHQALDWMFKSDLVRAGTLIGYDDWWVNPCSSGGGGLHPLHTAEGRAHDEVSRAYNVKFRCVAGPCFFDKEDAVHKCNWGTVFIVDALGAGTVPAHGFQMTKDEIESWKKLNP